MASIAFILVCTTSLGLIALMWASYWILYEKAGKSRMGRSHSCLQGICSIRTDRKAHILAYLSSYTNCKYLLYHSHIGSIPEIFWKGFRVYGFVHILSFHIHTRFSI